MTEAPGIAAALLLGLLGSTHCLGMCGGISAALAMGIDPASSRNRRVVLLLGYNLGRIGSYAVLGALLGLLSGLLLDNYQQAMLSLRVAAGVLLILMGLYLAGWSRLLLGLERRGAALWQPLQRYAARLFRGTGMWRALAAGAVWGWLPCGLVYSTLAWAGTSGDWRSSAVLMLAFGIGTTPAVLGSGLAANVLGGWLRKSPVRAAVGLLIIAFGCWTVAVPQLHGQHTDHGAEAVTTPQQHPHHH